MDNLDNISINDMIQKLRDAGYVVIKPNKRQKEDMDKCEACGFKGECFSCTCSICIMQS